MKPVTKDDSGTCSPDGTIEHLWQEWDLILNVNLHLLPSCWGFSFALGYGVSPHRRSSAHRLTGISLTLDMGYLFRAASVKCRRRS